MINFYNEKLAPAMLCKLLHDVVPYKFHRPVIFSYGYRHIPEGYRRCRGVTDYKYVWLNLEAIAFEGEMRDHASHSAGIWRLMLHVGFHEFGHIAAEHWKVSTAKTERNYSHHRYIENQADAKAKEWITAVLRNNSRLYQPDFLGVEDIVRRRSQGAFMEMPKHGKYYNGRLKDIRCYKCGGQLSATDVVPLVFQSGFPKSRQQRIRLVHKFGDDIARKYFDRAGRCHHFWTWGDVEIIAQRLIENHEKENPEADVKRKPEESFEEWCKRICANIDRRMKEGKTKAYFPRQNRYKRY